MTATLCFHDGQYRGNAVQYTLDVDVDDPLPFLRLLRVHRRNGHHAGVVEDDVHTAKLLARKLNECVHVFVTGDIEAGIFGGAATFTDIRSDLLQTIRASRAQSCWRIFNGRAAHEMAPKLGLLAEEADVRPTSVSAYYGSY